MSIEFKVGGLTVAASCTKRDYIPVELSPEAKVFPARSRRNLLVLDGGAAFEIVPPGKFRDRLLAEYEQQQQGGDRERD